MCAVCVLLGGDTGTRDQFRFQFCYCKMCAKSFLVMTLSTGQILRIRIDGLLFPFVDDMGGLRHLGRGRFLTIPTILLRVTEWTM